MKLLFVRYGEAREEEVVDLEAGIDRARDLVECPVEEGGSPGAILDDDGNVVLDQQELWDRL